MSAHKPTAHPSSETGHPATLLDGTPYRFIAPLGHGAMGDVVEAEHVALGKRVVVKLLQERHANRPDFIDRMRIEAQALAKLTHPNLVQVTDFGQTAQGRTFLVMERLRGRNLREELEERKFLPVLEAMNIVRQSLQGLAAAHDAGIVHRDVKLENLFLCEASSNRRAVKVLDFGVAKVIGVAGDNTPLPLAFPTAEGVAMGTPRYFSPEQARGREVDWRTDVYAAGIVLYTLVTGRGPFDHHTTLLELTRAHAFEQPELPSRIAPQPIPPELDAAILKALAKEPLDRFPTALAFAVELERVSAKLTAETRQQQQQASVPPPSEAPQLEPPTRPTAQLPGISDDELEATLQKIPARAAAATHVVSPPSEEPTLMKFPQGPSPIEEATLLKFPKGALAAAARQTPGYGEVAAPTQSEPEPPTVRVDGDAAVAAAVASVTAIDEESGAPTQRIAAPVLMKLRQSTAEPAQSQPAPTTKPTAHAPGKSHAEIDDSRPKDSSSFEDVDGPVPTDPSAGQTSVDTFAKTPAVAAVDNSERPTDPISLPLVAPGSLVKSESAPSDDSAGLSESGERPVTFAGRAAEHASGAATRGDRISALPGRRADRISALPGRSGERVSALPGRKDRISALPGRPIVATERPADDGPAAEPVAPKKRSAQAQTPAQVHIPGPAKEKDDAASTGVRPMKAPVPWRVRRTAPGAARAPTVQPGGRPLDAKPDNTRLYYIIIAMIAVIAAGTFLLLKLAK